MKRQILNVVTFLRGAEPRRIKANLIKPLRKQIKYLEKSGLCATFLFQYDALIRDDFITEIKKHPGFELGVWMEMNEPHVLAAGLEWRGKASWDPHAYCAMTIGYTESEREKLADAIFEKFKQIFGYYPRVMGAWALDAHTMAYVSDKYGMDAFCNCKDQWGTDGYNLWGGYYAQAYYPSVNNAFAPAQSKEKQISVPVFRMLGSDPVLQYDHNLDPKKGALMQGVVTLEPVYSSGGGGGNKKWVDWYMRENFNGKCLTFGYAQAGQENSFSWKDTKKGLKYQFPLFAALRDQGKIEVETLGASGRWFKQTFAETPAAVVAADNDWQNKGKKSYWYDCKRYRLNFYVDENRVFRIRDLYLFDENYRERYLGNVCAENTLIYDNLPIMDGLRFTGDGKFAGIYFMRDGKELKCTSVDYSENGDEIGLNIKTDDGDAILLNLSPDSITVKGKNAALTPVYSARTKDMLSAHIIGGKIDFIYNGFSYSICSDHGFENGFVSLLSDDEIKFSFC